MSANAKVTVIFEMEYECGSWGEDCTVKQLRDQARRQAEGAAQRMLKLANDADMTLRLRAIEPVTAVILPDPKRSM